MDIASSEESLNICNRGVFASAHEFRFVVNSSGEKVMLG